MDLDIVFLGTSASAPTARRGTERAAHPPRRRTTALRLRRGDSAPAPPLLDRARRAREDLHLPIFTPTTTSGFPDCSRPSRSACVKHRSRSTAHRDCASSSTGWGGCSDGSATASNSSRCDPAMRRGRRLRAARFPCNPRHLSRRLCTGRDPRDRGDSTSQLADELGVPFGPERGRLQRGEAVVLADGRTVSADRTRRAKARRPNGRSTRATRPRPTPSGCSSRAPTCSIHESTFADEEA